MGAVSPELQLPVSELPTKMITHLGEGTPVTVSVQDAGDARTRVAVTEPRPLRRPVPRPAGTDDESGRDLAPPAATGLLRGVDRSPGSRTVWCEPPGPAEPPDAGRVTDAGGGLLLITDG
ncbi:ATP-binding protein [Streptomyces sp. NPDC059017]|uniref:ATP-binding protein n=1 Tax=unclassified Streptomyces TaxID=2593676 RepID=UPI00367C0B1F